MEKIYRKLTDNLEAMLHESMVKIGYVKGQPVGIYYAEELLHHLLDVDENFKQREKVNIALQRLEQFAQENEEEWGKISFERQEGRYKLIVPAKGMEYVYEKNKNNHFLENLIAILRIPQVTIEKVLEVFRRYSDEVICEKSQDEEFEYAVRFANPKVDPFIYCFTFDEMGQYYHRFTEYDYRKLKEE